MVVRVFGIQVYYSKPQELEHPCPLTPKGRLKGIPALIILNPSSNFGVYCRRFEGGRVLRYWGALCFGSQNQ